MSADGPAAQRESRKTTARRAAERPAGAPWYIDGLRFGCTACGKCCHNHGDGYQYVFSTRAERKALAQHLELSLRQFEARYCAKVDGRYSFKSRNQACIFLEDNRCSVYALRPKQCSAFPFWPELFEDEQTWEQEVASFCPGVGQGPLHDVRGIRARLKAFGG